MKYYYISVWTPIGYTGIYYRGQEHPLAKEAYRTRREAIARQMSLRSGEVIPPDSICYLTIHDLPIEVAKEQWPGDFENIQPPPPPPCRTIVEGVSVS